MYTFYIKIGDQISEGGENVFKYNKIREYMSFSSHLKKRDQFFKRKS